MKHKVLGKEIERLINALSKLPSIGNKTASRLSLFLMKNSPELTMEIARSMVEARKKVKTCQICNNFILARSRVDAQMHLDLAVHIVIHRIPHPLRRMQHTQFSTRSLFHHEVKLIIRPTDYFIV